MVQNEFVSEVTFFHHIVNKVNISTRKKIQRPTFRALPFVGVNRLFAVATVSTDVFEPCTAAVARHFYLSNHSRQHMTVNDDDDDDNDNNDNDDNNNGELN